MSRLSPKCSRLQGPSLVSPGTEVAAGGPSDPSDDTLLVSKGGQLKPFWRVSWENSPCMELRQSLGCAMGCTSHRDDTPTAGIPSPKTAGAGDTLGDSMTGHSLEGVTEGLEAWEQSRLLPFGQGRQLSILNQGGDGSWLWGGHHPSPIRTFPLIPAGSQLCFSSKVEDKNSLGGAGREQSGPCKPSCPLQIPHRGCQDPPHAFLVKTSPKTQLLAPAKTWLSQGTGAGDAMAGSARSWQEEAAPGQTAIS